MTPDEQLRSHGYCSMPALSPAQCDALMQGLQSLWKDAGAPSVYSAEDRWLSEHVHISPVGFTRQAILEALPQCAQLLLHPPLIDALRTTLGPEFELELGAAVLSDASRPFFFWHHHIGGIDGESQRRRGTYPIFDRVERVACTFYLSPLDTDHGAMQLLPRALSDATGPSGEVHAPSWPNAKTLMAPAGTLLMIEQCTWHSVHPMRGPGRRAFISFFVRRAGVKASRVDASVARALERDPELAAIYRA